MADPWDDNDYVDPDMAKAMTHPLRNHILAELNKEAMSPSQFTKRHEVSGRILSDFLNVAAEAMLEGTFDSRKNRHAAWQRIHLDEQGWKETSDIILRAFREVMKSSKEANRRLIRSGETGLMATWGLLLFESPMPTAEEEAGEAPA